MQKAKSEFSRNIAITVFLFVALVVIFSLYIVTKKRIDHLNDHRHLLFLLSDELRHSGNELTALARSFVVTGNPVYKKYYQEVLDVRDGKISRPQSYSNLYDKLTSPNSSKPSIDNETAILLLNRIRKSGADDEEFSKLAEAKKNSDLLAILEKKAMSMVESSTPDFSDKHVSAINLLFSDQYNLAKANVIKSINEFYALVDADTLSALKNAQYRAAILGYVFSAISIVLVFFLWQSSNVMRKVLGGNLDDVFSHISSIGKGNFSTTLSLNGYAKNSVLGWLAHMQAALNASNEKHRKMEKSLRESEARYRRIVLTAEEGVWEIDENNITSFVNPKMASILGYREDEMLGQSPTQFMGDAEKLILREKLERRMLGFKDRYYLKLQHKDGSDRWCEISTFPMFDENKKYAGSLGMVTDISERKKTEAALQENAGLLKVISDNIPGMIAYWSADLRCLFSNKEYFKWFGRTQEDMQGIRMQDLLGDRLFAKNERYIRAVLHGEDQQFERNLIMPSGEVGTTWAQYIAHKVNGVVVGFYALIVDITQVKRAEKLLLASKQALQDVYQYTQAIIDNMADGLITLNSKGEIELFNNAACNMFGYAMCEIVGHSISELIVDHRRDNFFDGIKDIDGNVIAQVKGKRKDGKLFFINVSVSELMHSDKVTYICEVRDTTQERKNIEEVHRLAFYDPLTELPNRRLLFDRLNHAVLTSSRTDQHGALMIIDLDNFKQLNDTLGHVVGDVLLQQVGSRLQYCIREGDTVARMGGDEFVVLLEALDANIVEAAIQADVIAHKILHALRKSYNLESHSYVITPSIGVTLFLNQIENTNELFKKADLAMYQAKAFGRNTIRFFDPSMQTLLSERVTLEASMRRALSRNEFVLHYQLQVDGQGNPIGVEALIRWNHAERGVLLPEFFIPMAEETGMILAIGQWVLETACAQLVEWAKNPATHMWTMAINVSASQFARSDFVDTLKKVLQKTNVNSKKLKLELTESMFLNDIEDVILKMQAIKALGVTFSLDDFGTGYSSLNYLKRLPLDQLKIDQSFVRDLMTNTSDEAIANTVVTLGHSLGLKVIAEGVETIEQRNFLAKMGCDAYQGYYFGRPVPALNLTGDDIFV